MKAFILDFGNVLYKYDSSNFNNTLKNVFGLSDDHLALLSKGVFNDYMTGTYTSEEVVTEVRKYSPQFTLADFQNLFISSLSKNDDMVLLLKRLKYSYKLGLLTDTGPVPYALFMAEELVPLFDAVTLSFHIGVKKPNKIMYEDIIKKLDLLSSEMLFVDDKKENIIAAQALGMQGYLFDSYDLFVKYLESQNIII